MCPWNSMVGSDDSFPLGEKGLFSGGYVCFGEGMYFFCSGPNQKKVMMIFTQDLGRLPDLYVIFVQTFDRVFCVFFPCESFSKLVWLYLTGVHFWDSTKWLDIFGFGGFGAFLQRTTFALELVHDQTTTTTTTTTKPPPPNQNQNRHHHHGLIVLTSPPQGLSSCSGLETLFKGCSKTSTSSIMTSGDPQKIQQAPQKVMQTVPCKSKDNKFNGLSEKIIISVGIYNQQFQGTILLIVFDLQGVVCLYMIPNTDLK